MKKSDAIKFFGSAAKLARALQIDSSAVSRWGEDVPRCRQGHIEFATGGALKSAETIAVLKRTENADK